MSSRNEQNGMSEQCSMSEQNSRGEQSSMSEQCSGKKQAGADPIKKGNKKALKVFIPVVILAGVFGGVCGFFIQTDGVQGVAEVISGGFNRFFYIFSPYGVMASYGIAFVTAWVIYRKAKRLERQLLAEGQEGENEELFETLDQQIDRQLNCSMITLNVGMILSFMFFACIMSNLDRYVDENRISCYVAVVVFIVGCFALIRLEQVQVDLVKRMNPQKSASVYDLKFHEKWEESCDEMEKLMIYRSGYKAYMAANRACSILWVIFSMSSLLFHFGPMPAIIVTIIWLVLLLSYYREAVRLEKEKINE